MRGASAARHFTFRVPTKSTLPPLISLSGHNPIQDANAEALRNLVKSTPQTRFNSERRTPSFYCFLVADPATPTGAARVEVGNPPVVAGFRGRSRRSCFGNFGKPAAAASA